jgi:hypothetical protein
MTKMMMCTRRRLLLMEKSVASMRIAVVQRAKERWPRALEMMQGRQRLVSSTSLVSILAVRQVPTAVTMLPSKRTHLGKLLTAVQRAAERRLESWQ